jgi:hypothetical protein
MRRSQLKKENQQEKLYGIYEKLAQEIRSEEIFKPTHPTVGYLKAFGVFRILSHRHLLLSP